MFTTYTGRRLHDAAGEELEAAAGERRECERLLLLHARSASAAHRSSGTQAAELASQLRTAQRQVALLVVQRQVGEAGWVPVRWCASFQ